VPAPQPAHPVGDRNTGATGDAEAAGDVPTVNRRQGMLLPIVQPYLIAVVFSVISGGQRVS